jgi:hypothetical protein
LLFLIMASGGDLFGRPGRCPDNLAVSYQVVRLAWTLPIPN